MIILEDYICPHTCPHRICYDEPDLRKISLFLLEYFIYCIGTGIVQSTGKDPAKKAAGALIRSSQDKGRLSLTWECIGFDGLLVHSWTPIYHVHPFILLQLSFILAAVTGA